MKEHIGICGQVKARLRDEFGTLKLTVFKDNTIVYIGYDHIRQSISKSSGRPAAADYVALGTGASGVVLTDTTLGTEIVRKLSTFSMVETYPGFKDQWKLITNFSGGEGTGTITESGVFNAVSGGSMLCRTVFSGIQKGSSDSLEFVWTFTVSQS